jgi:hypothetical protein
VQISEDHCWITLGANPCSPHEGEQGLRERSVEVTTATASKRGLAVEPAAWAGWLYAGGNATVCTPHQAAAALVASVDPAITRGKKGKDSEGLQLLQRRLLARMLGRHPAALYPAALCVLADLLEVRARRGEEKRGSAGLEQGCGGVGWTSPGLEQGCGGVGWTPPGLEQGCGGLEWTSPGLLE